MIKILYVLQGLDNGGVESFILNYFTEIDKDHFNADFIVHGSKVGLLESKIERLGGKIYHIPTRKEALFQNLKQFKKIIFSGNYDVIHCHIDVMSIIPLFYAKKAKIRKRIIHSHMAFPHLSFIRKVLNFFLKPWLKIFSTDLFACGLDAGRSLYGDKAVDNKKVHIMKNAIDVNKFSFNKKTRDEIRKKMGIENKLVIGNVGRITYQKNHKFLINIFYEIYKTNKDAVLVLIGDGDLEDKIKEQVKNFNLNDAVIFLGKRNDVADLYQIMDVFVLSSWFEGLPVVGVEAQAAGCKCFFADSITREIKLLESTKYFSLNMTPNYWAEQILQDFSFIDRQRCGQIVQQKGYDVKNETKDLEFYYQKK